jgi:hypothetical protein
MNHKLIGHLGGFSYRHLDSNIELNNSLTSQILYYLPIFLFFKTIGSALFLEPNITASN